MQWILSNVHSITKKKSGKKAFPPKVSQRSSTAFSHCQSKPQCTRRPWSQRSVYHIHDSGSRKSTTPIVDRESLGLRFTILQNSRRVCVRNGIQTHVKRHRAESTQHSKYHTEKVARRLLKTLSLEEHITLFPHPAMFYRQNCRTNNISFAMARIIKFRTLLSQRTEAIPRPRALFPVCTP